PDPTRSVRRPPGGAWGKRAIRSPCPSRAKTARSRPTAGAARRGRWRASSTAWRSRCRSCRHERPVHAPRGPAPAPQPRDPGRDQQHRDADEIAVLGGAALHAAPEHERWRGAVFGADRDQRSEEHTSELQSPCNLVCRLLLEKKKKKKNINKQKTCLTI